MNLEYCSTKDKRVIRSSFHRAFPVAFAAGLLLLFGFPRVGVAASNSWADHYVAEIWQVADGLPGNSVTSVVQTPDGYLWVGTTSGLARFDGVRFEIFDINTPGLERWPVKAASVSSETNSVKIVDDAGFWLFHGREVRRFEEGRWTREMEAPREFEAESITCGIEDSSGNLWVGTSR